MNKFGFIPSLLIAFLILSNSFCKPEVESQEIQNLKAFAKLYGYVRYFHPSDEASQIDWDRFVIYGVEKAKNATNRQELKSVLEELFLPVAPTIQVYYSGEEPAEPELGLFEDTSGLKVVAWQHKGLGSGSANSAYMSKRLNRDIVLKPVMPGVLTQGVDATLLRGKEKIRFDRTSIDTGDIILQE